METSAPGSSWPPNIFDKYSPSAGLLNYQWSDAVLRQELDDMNLLDPSSAAQAHPGASGAPPPPQQQNQQQQGQPQLQQQQQQQQQHHHQQQQQQASSSASAAAQPPRAPTPGPPAAAFLNQGLSVEEEDRRKRSREAMENSSLESFLQDLAREETGMGDLLGGRTSPEHDRRGRSHGGGDAGNAARTKACRERARRERLNECFADLAKVLEPGKAAKTDKTSIIADAVRVVTQLRAENGQLRQLNKFLEDRVKTVEKEKSEQQLQLLLLQQNHAAGPSLMPPPGQGGLPYPYNFAFGAGMPMGQPFPGLPPGMRPPAAPQPPQQQQQQQEAVKQEAASSRPATSEASPPLGLLPLGARPPGSEGLPASQAPPAGPSLFLPPSALDTSQDSLKRPPAA